MGGLSPTLYERICPDCTGDGWDQARANFCPRCRGQGLVPNEAGVALLKFLQQHGYALIRDESTGTYMPFSPRDFEDKAADSQSIQIEEDLKKRTSRLSREQL